jgi:hypothetical protein
MKFNKIELPEVSVEADVTQLFDLIHHREQLLSIYQFIKDTTT